MRGEGSPTLVNQRSQVRRVSCARSARAVTRRTVAGGVQHEIERLAQLRRQLPQGRLERLHDLLRGALLQLAQQRGTQRTRGVLEAMDDHPADPRAPELQQHGGVGRGEVGVDQERERWEEKPKPLDAVGTRCPARQERIDDRHVDRLGPDDLHRLGPAVHGDPLEPVRIQGPQPEQALGGDGGQEQVSQIGP